MSSIDENIQGIKILEKKSELHGAAVCTISGKLPDATYDRVDSAPQAVKANGQHADYYVLCDAERAKGFVRPVRASYIHKGIRPIHPTRDLTDEELKTYAVYGYVKYETYPNQSQDSVVGCFWTVAQLRSGCGTRTTMGQKLAETYARDPGFYGATFCCGCGKHLPVEEFVWEDGTRVGS